MPIVASAEIVKPVKNGMPQAPAAKKKEKVTLRKKESKTNFVHSWLSCNLKAHSGRVLSLDFSPNGKYLASCSEGSFPKTFSVFFIVPVFSQRYIAHLRACNVRQIHIKTCYATR